MAAKTKKSAASEKSAAFREMRQQQQQQQQQHYQRQSPPQTHIIKDDETLLIDPAIVAAENPDVSSPVFHTYDLEARPLKLFFALLAIHTLPDTLDPCLPHHPSTCHRPRRRHLRGPIKSRDPLPSHILSHRHTLRSVAWSSFFRSSFIGTPLLRETQTCTATFPTSVYPLDPFTSNLDANVYCSDHYSIYAQLMQVSTWYACFRVPVCRVSARTGVLSFLTCRHLGPSTVVPTVRFKP